MDFIINDDVITSHDEDDTDEFREVFFPRLPGYKWVVGKQTPIETRRKIIAEFIYDVCELNEISEDNGDDKALLADDVALYLILKNLGVECSEEYENHDRIIRLFYALKSQYLASKHIRNEARSRQFLQRMVADHQRVGKPKDYRSQLPHGDGHAKTYQMRILCSVLSKRIHHVLFVPTLIIAVIDGYFGSR